MLFRHRILCTALILAGGLPVSAQERDEAADALRLQTAGLPTDGPGLLAFFRQRSRNHVAPEKLTALIGKLGDKDKDERDKAVRELVGLGPLAVPALRLAVSDPDDTTGSVLARRCLATLQGDDAADLAAVAARVLASRRPKDTVEALLGYLPFTDKDETLDEVRAALAEAASGPDGKPDAALVAALTDDLPLRRAVAVEVLAARDDAPPTTLRSLLGDAKASVRLRAALVLARQKDAKAVSTLVVLLGELPLNYAREAEDFLLGLAAEQAPKIPLGADAAARQKARDAWAEWWLKSEKPGLLDEFRKRTMDDAARDKALALIRDLGNENFKVRDAANDKLKSMGVLVLPLLRKASKEQKDVEVQGRAKALVIEIEKVEKGPLSPVTARLVALRKPEGAVEVLLRYLPFADDESVLTEVQGALNALAYRDGKPDARLVAALADKRPALRAVAAEALTHGATVKGLAEVRKLLKDQDGSVRLQTALALAGLREREAVPVLIGLIGELPSEQSAPAEEFLARLAGDDTPPGDAGTDAAAREKRRDAWAKWWKEKGDKVRMLARNEVPRRQHLLGLTLLISPNNHRIVEVGQDGKVRWEILNVSQVWDVQVLGKNRLLVLESGVRRITERTMRGDVLWQQQIPNNIWPTGVRRLRNGNTFLIGGNALVEITRTGREVQRINRPQGDILAARKFKNGQIIYVTSSGFVQRIDARGKEVKSWNMPANPTNQGIHILDNGNIVYPQQHGNRVYECDTNGKQVWTAAAQQPAAVWRLPNGHTLISSAWPNQVIEVDRAGKEVWKTTAAVQALRVYRR